MFVKEENGHPLVIEKKKDKQENKHRPINVFKKKRKKEEIVVLERGIGDNFEGHYGSKRNRDDNFEETEKEEGIKENKGI